MLKQRLKRLVACQVTSDGSWLFSAALAFYLFIRITKTKSVDLRAIIAVAGASIAISNHLR